MVNAQTNLFMHMLSHASCVTCSHSYHVVCYIISHVYTFAQVFVETHLMCYLRSGASPRPSPATRSPEGGGFFTGLQRASGQTGFSQKGHESTHFVILCFEHMHAATFHHILFICSHEMFPSPATRSSEGQMTRSAGKSAYGQSPN